MSERRASGIRPEVIDPVLFLLSKSAMAAKQNDEKKSTSYQR
jgi:hypothetical protein